MTDPTIPDTGDTWCQGTYRGRHGRYLCAGTREPGQRYCPAHHDEDDETLDLAQPTGDRGA